MLFSTRGRRHLTNQTRYLLRREVGGERTERARVHAGVWCLACPLQPHRGFCKRMPQALGNCCSQLGNTCVTVLVSFVYEASFISIPSSNDDKSAFCCSWNCNELPIAHPLRMNDTHFLQPFAATSSYMLKQPIKLIRPANYSSACAPKLKSRTCLKSKLSNLAPKKRKKKKSENCRKSIPSNFMS